MAMGLKPQVCDGSRWQGVRLEGGWIGSEGPSRATVRTTCFRRVAHGFLRRGQLTRALWGLTAGRRERGGCLRACADCPPWSEAPAEALAETQVSYALPHDPK